MIDTEALRKKVIDLAIQGKLTEQLPSDGDAEVLYTQIQAEKERQIKAGQLRKTKGFSEITEENLPYDFPKEWVVCYIDDIAFVTKLAGFEYTKYIADSVCDEGIPLFKGKNIQKGELVLEFESYIPESVSDELPRSKVNKKCLLTPYVGTIGNIALFDGSFAAHLGSNVGKIEILNPEDICLKEEYLLYYLRSSIGFSELTKHRKATAQDSISIDAIRNVIIAIPPIEQQERIIKRIDDVLQMLDDIDTLQKQYESDLSVLKGKIIDAGIRGKLTEQLPGDGDAEVLYSQIQEEKTKLIKEGKIKKEKPMPDITADEIPFEIPKNWKWVRWGQIVNIVSARRVHQSDWRKEGIAFYRAREIAKLADSGYVDNDLFISEDLYNEFSKTGVPHAGDLMVSAVGTLGKTYVVTEDDHFYYKDASVLCFENFAQIVPEYLRFLMYSNVTKKQIESNSGGTTVDTLTMVRMNAYILPLPPLKEQKRIASKINCVLTMLV